MPKFLEERLQAGAAKHGFTGKRAARYVYGAMNNIGAMRGNKETAKGARMAAKHASDTKKGRRGRGSSGQGTLAVARNKTLGSAPPTRHAPGNTRQPHAAIQHVGVPPHTMNRYGRLRHGR